MRVKTSCTKADIRGLSAEPVYGCRIKTPCGAREFLEATQLLEQVGDKIFEVKHGKLLDKGLIDGNFISEYTLSFYGKERIHGTRFESIFDILEMIRPVEVV